ncbi:hypothetical protein U1Q18_005255 [Sarracenia purpurea var. burkii]
MEVGEDEEVLKAVYFQNVNVVTNYMLFQQANGLLHRCAKVGNEAAQYLLAKIILMSSTQLLAKIKETERIQTFGGQSIADETRLAKLASASSFMTHFVPNQACGSSSTKASAQTLLHWELVRKFLCHCTVVDFTDMHPLLNCYIDYFINCATHENLILHHFINKMCESAFRLRWSQEWNLEGLRAKLREQMQLMVEKRSRSNLEELRAKLREQMQLMVEKQSGKSSHGLIREGKPESVVEVTGVEDYDKRSKDQRSLQERKLQNVREANPAENFVEMLSREEWFMSASFRPMYRVGDFGRNPWDFVSMFEESRINALVCFDNVFP